MVEIEGELGSATGNLLAIFNEFFNASHLWEGRRHRTNAPSADGLSVFRQTAAALYAGAADMNNHLEVGGNGLDPCLGQFHAFFFGEHISFTRRAIDEHAF